MDPVCVQAVNASDAICWQAYQVMNSPMQLFLSPLVKAESASRLITNMMANQHHAS